MNNQVEFANEKKNFKNLWTGWKIGKWKSWQATQNDVYICLFDIWYGLSLRSEIWIVYGLVSNLIFLVMEYFLLL